MCGKIDPSKRGISAAVIVVAKERERERERERETKYLLFAEKQGRISRRNKQLRLTDKVFSARAVAWFMS